MLGRRTPTARHSSAPSPKLECNQQAYVFSSGMAAIDAVFRLLRPGDHTIISKAVYGGTFRLTTKLLVEFGLEFTYVDTSPSIKCEAAVKPSNTG